MRAILINVYRKTVTEVELPDDVRGWLDSAYSQLSLDAPPENRCSMVEIGCRIPRKDHKEDTLYVDEEGLLHPSDHFFYYEGAHQPFAGSGLICGSDPRTGHSIPAAVDVPSVLRKVRFMNRFDAALLAQERGRR
jgi:hypothetical protein